MESFPTPPTPVFVFFIGSTFSAHLVLSYLVFCSLFIPFLFQYQNFSFSSLVVSLFRFYLVLRSPFLLPPSFRVLGLDFRFVWDGVRYGIGGGSVTAGLAIGAGIGILGWRGLGGFGNG